MNGQELADRIGQLMLDKKGSDIVIMDLAGVTTMADFFVLCSADSDIQVKAIADHVQDSLAREGIKSWHIEGMSALSWVLVDFVDVVVHIYQPRARKFYGLERLWGDAKFTWIKDDDETATLHTGNDS